VSSKSGVAPRDRAESHQRTLGQMAREARLLVTLCGLLDRTSLFLSPGTWRNHGLERFGFSQVGRAAGRTPGHCCKGEIAVNGLPHGSEDLDPCGHRYPSVANGDSMMTANRELIPTRFTWTYYGRNASTPPTVFPIAPKIMQDVLLIPVLGVELSNRGAPGYVWPMRPYRSVLSGSHRSRLPELSLGLPASRKP
jgi:hypothetical protein